MASFERNLGDPIYELALNRAKMVFISGPRQVGKTTLSQQLSNRFNKVLYKNWDQDLVVKAWAKNPETLLSEFDFSKTSQSRLLILDEIHKSKNWKNKLKGLYDLHHDEIKIIVTGSARLNTYKKGGDSLLGRYLNFRLHPFSLGELASRPIDDPHSFLKKVLRFDQDTKAADKNSEAILQRLYLSSGFPEPYLAQNERIHTIWRKDRRDRIIREDLRDLNRVQEISQLQTLALLLPEKVSSPLSIESLREDLSTSHESVTRWLRWFQELYIHFELKPWSKDIKRSLKKEGKIYLYDWTEIEAGGARFENLIACHLLKACQSWTDLGYGEFDLHYLRNKEKEEVDFLLTQNRKPWLAIEAKLSEPKIDIKTFERFSSQVSCPFIHVTMEPDIFWKDKTRNFYSMSATHLLSHLP
jgi:predicted AAA+ superfamily ATPase